MAKDDAIADPQGRTGNGGVAVLERPQRNEATGGDATLAPRPGVESLVAALFASHAKEGMPPAMEELARRLGAALQAGQHVPAAVADGELDEPV